MEDNFENGKFTEAELENAFIELFRNTEHYEYCNGEELHRKYTDVLLYEDLKKYLKKDLTKNVITIRFVWQTRRKGLPKNTAEILKRRILQGFCTI